MDHHCGLQQLFELKEIRFMNVLLHVCFVLWKFGKCRDFNEADYDALLQLDSEVTQSRPQISDATLRTLQTHVHKCGKAADPGGNSCKPGKDTSKISAVRDMFITGTGPSGVNALAICLN